MKKIITHVLISSIFILANSFTNYAQDYKMFYSGQDHFFYSGNGSQIVQYFANYYSWSEIKETRFDSIIGSAGDTLYYPFHTWRDTTDFTDTVQPCAILNGPSWMGQSIHELSNGTTWLFNIDNDSIRIDHAASSGQSWTMMNLTGGGSVNATVDSLFILTMAGITDSVKQIRLHVLDSIGSIDSLHALHQKVIWISKSNGLLRGLSFRDLPQYAMLERIEPIPMITYGDLYDFNPGDEFEYYHSCQNIWGTLSPPTWTYNRVLAKWYSSAMDTVFYSLALNAMTFQYNPNPPPLYVPVYSSSFDTVYYTNLNTPIYTEVPEQNTYLHFTLYPDFGVYHLNKDSSYFNGRPVYSEINGFYYLIDSCMQFYNFEPIFYTAEVSAGLGITETSYDYRSQSGDYCSIRLIWYHKGNETYGNYVSVIAGIEEANNQNDILLYPNPAAKNCIVQLDPAKYSSMILYSPGGQKLKTWNLFERNNNIDLSDVSPGIYYLQVFGKNEVLLKKVIRIQD